MSRWLSRPGFWLALMLAVSGLFFISACDRDTPDPDDNCTKLGGGCKSDGACCYGLKCLDGICDARVSCSPVGGRCGASRPCCGTATCRTIGTDNRVCDDGSCVGRGGGCGPGVTCCGTLLCRSNVCAD